jgi:hypothetical protein
MGGSNPFAISALVRSEWSAPHPGRFAPGKSPLPVRAEAGWDSVPVSAVIENLAPTGIRSPDHQALVQKVPRHSESHMRRTRIFRQKIFNFTYICQFHQLKYSRPKPFRTISERPSRIYELKKAMSSVYKNEIKFLLYKNINISKQSQLMHNLCISWLCYDILIVCIEMNNIKSIFVVNVLTQATSPTAERAQAGEKNTLTNNP